MSSAGASASIFGIKLGLEYTLMWTIATFYVLVHGGGLYSLDHLIGWE